MSYFNFQDRDWLFESIFSQTGNIGFLSTRDIDTFGDLTSFEFTIINQYKALMAFQNNLRFLIKTTIKTSNIWHGNRQFSRIRS